jgi:hypothetical protein
VSVWDLQKNNNVAIPARWSTSGGVTTLNGTNYLNIANSPANSFFRLRQFSEGLTTSVGAKVPTQALRGTKEPQLWVLEPPSL